MRQSHPQSGIFFMHISISPEKYYSKYYPATRPQINILDVMDSCRVTLVPPMRAVGTTTAIASYMEWEFLYSQFPVELTYTSPHTNPRMDVFRHISHTRHRDTYRDRGNEIYVTSNNHLFRSRGEGLYPSDLYVFDTIQEHEINDLFSFIMKIESQKGKRRPVVSQSLPTTAYASTADKYQNHIQTFEGSRYVIVTGYPEDLINPFLNMGFEEDDIGVVDLTGAIPLVPDYKWYAPVGTRQGYNLSYTIGP